MKIVCFIFDRNIGGPHVRARAIYRRMSDDGHEARIAIPRGPGTAEAFYRDAGIAVDRLSIRKPVPPNQWRSFVLYLLALPLGVMHTITYLRRERPDVIHVNGAFDLVPAFAGKLAGVPMVWHLNDMAVPRRMARLLGRIVAAIATKIVISSPPVAAHYGLGMDQTEVVFPPVDTKHFRIRPPGRHPMRPAVIGLVANWNPLKGHDKFVEIIWRLKSEGYAVRARILGHFLDSQKNYWSSILEKIERAGLREDIDCLGFVDDPAAEIWNFDLLLVTSRSEAGPMSVLEAMSVGVPQVCFRVGAVDEFLKHGGDAPSGISVRPDDVDAMVKAIKLLLTNQDFYQKCARAGQERARAMFSLDACAKRQEAIYSLAIEKTRIGRRAYQ